MNFSKYESLTGSERTPVKGEAPRSRDREGKKREESPRSRVPQAAPWRPPVATSAAQAQPTAPPQSEAEATNKRLLLPKVELKSETLVLIACLSIAILMLISYLLGMVSGGTAFGVGLFLCAALVSIEAGFEKSVDVVNAVINALAFYGICSLLPNWPVPVVSWLCIGTLFLGSLGRRGLDNPMRSVVLAWWFVAIGLFIASLCSWN